MIGCKDDDILIFVEVFVWCFFSWAVFFGMFGSWSDSRCFLLTSSVSRFTVVELWTSVIISSIKMKFGASTKFRLFSSTMLSFDEGCLSDKFTSTRFESNLRVDFFCTCSSSIHFYISLCLFVSYSPYLDWLSDQSYLNQFRRCIGHLPASCTFLVNQQHVQRWLG